MKKKLFLIFIIIIVFILLILSFRNSKPDLATILNKTVKIPDNVYIKEEMINNANTTTTTNTYKKDNIIYQHIENDDSTANQDILFDFNTYKEIIVDNLSKTIDAFEIADDSYSPLTDIFISFNELSKEELKKYKYEGEETINGNNCVKISLTQNSYNITYFYIATDTGLLYQKEEGQYYNDAFALYYKYNYTYSYNTVTDDDILVFNAENYPDYTYLEK